MVCLLVGMQVVAALGAVGSVLCPGAMPVLPRIPKSARRCLWASCHPIHRRHHGKWSRRTPRLQGMCAYVRTYVHVIDMPWTGCIPTHNSTDQYGCRYTTQSV